MPGASRGGGLLPLSIRGDATRTLGFQVIGLGAGLATNIIVARTLGPEGKGLLAFLAYTLFIVLSLGGLGLQSAAIHSLGRREFPPGAIAGALLLVGLLSGVLCAAVLALLLPLFAAPMNLPPALLPVFLGTSILALLQLHLSGVMIGLDKIRIWNRVQSLNAILWCIGAVVVLGVLRGNSTAAASTWMAAQAIGSLVTIVWVLRQVPPRRGGLRSSAPSLLRFGLEAYFANLLWTLLLRSDGFLLGYLQGPVSIGLYSVSVLLAEVLWYLPRSLTIALNPRIASGTREVAMELAQRAVRIGIWLVGLGALALAILARPIVSLVFGEAFAGAVPPLLLLLPGIVAGTIASPLALYFTQQRGRPRLNAAASGVGLVLNVALNLTWIPRFGSAGAALATSLSYGVVAVFLLVLLRREPGFAWANLLALRSEDLRLLRDSLRESVHRLLAIARPAGARRKRA